MQLRQHSEVEVQFVLEEGEYLLQVDHHDVEPRPLQQREQIGRGKSGQLPRVPEQHQGDRRARKPANRMRAPDEEIRRQFRAEAGGGGGGGDEGDGARPAESELRERADGTGGRLHLAVRRAVPQLLVRGGAGGELRVLEGGDRGGVVHWAPIRVQVELREHALLRRSGPEELPQERAVGVQVRGEFRRLEAAAPGIQGGAGAPGLVD